MNNRYYFYITDEQYKIAESNGICKCTLKGRVERGWDMEKAITLPPGSTRKRRKWCDKILEIAKSNGIGVSSLDYRTRVNKLSPYKAATTPLNPNKKPPSYETPEVIKICAANGISKTTFRTRVRVLGWSVERAMTQPVIQYEKSYTYVR